MGSVLFVLATVLVVVGIMGVCAVLLASMVIGGLQLLLRTKPKKKKDAHKKRHDTLHDTIAWWQTIRRNGLITAVFCILALLILTDGFKQWS